MALSYVQKIKKNWRLIQAIRIYKQDAGMEFTKKMCYVDTEKCKKRNKETNRFAESASNQKKYGEKENYKLLEDTIK